MIKDEKIFIAPDEALNKFLEWFNVKKRIAFITAMIVGIITHLAMLTETIMSQDGLWNSMQYSRPGEWEFSLGRWGIVLIQRINNFIAIPNITTIFCLVIMSIIAVILTDLFDFKSKISIICTSAILVLFPTFTVTLLYVYTSIAYCFCMLLSCLSIWFLYKLKNKKAGIILSIICFIFSLSIYQSYAGFTIGLCIILSIIQLLKSEKTVKEVVKQILKTASVIIIGGLLYLVITNILLNYYNIEFTNYKGSKSEITNIIPNIVNSIKDTYKDFMAFFFRDRIVYNTNYRREVSYLLLFVVSGILGILNILKMNYTDKKDRIIKILFCMLLLIILPMGLNIINIITLESEIYSLTASQMILVIPLCMILYENVDKANLIKWFSVIACLSIMLTYFLADNTSYSALKLTYNQAYSTTSRLIDRIETTQGYQRNYPILFGGIVGNNNFPRTSSLYDYTIGSVVNNTAFHGTYGGQVGTWVNFIKIFFGLDIIPCDANIYHSIINSDEYKEMEIFPAENSIKIKDGIVIVKLSDEPPMPF